MGSTRNLYRRSDARYGDDDPVCWPQPFNPNYPWYSAIIRKPNSFTSLADHMMWLDLRESDITYTAEGTRRKEGVVKKELTDELDSQIEPLKRRSLAWHKTNGDDFKRKFLKEHTDTIDVCLTRLKTVSASIRVQQLALTELQRGFLTVQAVLDYTDFESCSIASDAPLSFQRDKMGAFVWNDRDARMLFHAGLPVFFIRPWNTFDRQIVERFIRLLQPELPRVQMGPADPPYHTISMGQAGSDVKFSALRQASIQCFDTVSPFQNLHIPGGYSSSFQLGNGRILDPASSPSSHLREQPSSQSSSPHHVQHAKSRFRHSQPTRSAKPRKPDMNREFSLF